MSRILKWIKNKIFPSTYIGISVEQQELKISLVSKENGVTACTSIPALGKETSRHILDALHLEERARIATGLEGHEVVLRSLALPLKEKRKVLGALPFQLESLLPFPPEQTLVCPFQIVKDKRTTHVSVLATSKDLLADHLQRLSLLEIHPDTVTCVSVALLRVAKMLYPDNQDLLIFHLGMHKITFVLMQEGRIALCQSIPLGKNDLIEALRTVFPAKDEQALETAFSSLSLEGCTAFLAFKEKLIHALERLRVFIKEKTAVSETTPWILLGAFTSSIELSRIWKHIFQDAQLIPEASHVHTHCLSTGYALDALASGNNSVQWLQKEFIPAHHLRARKKKAMLFALSCLLLTVLLGISSSFFLQKRTRALSDKLYGYFPIPHSKQRALSLAEIEQELLKSETTLLTAKNAFPFFLTLPRVSEVLSWLSTHPALATADGLPKEGIEIKNFRYVLTKFPTLDDPSAPYAGHIEIEFIATIPRLAREFHDALLKGDRIVNPKKELKWNTQGNHYTVQFELNRCAS